MDKTRFLIRPYVGKLPLVILASILLVATSVSEVAQSQVSEADKQGVVRQVAQKWIEVGTEQYQRNFYKQAEQSFLRAQGYQEYLTAGEREKLSELLEKTRIAAVERERILKTIQTADELVEQGELIKAKAHLEKARGSEFLTGEEQKLITEGLEEIGSQLGVQEEGKEEIVELYNRSVEFYHIGQLEKAREGFAKVAESGLLVAPAGMTAEDYLMKIDSILGQRVKPLAPSKAEPAKEGLEAAVAAIKDELLDVEAEPAVEVEAAKESEPEVAEEPNKPAAVVVSEPVTEEGGYIEVVNRKRNIRRAHVKAVVDDAVTKAQSYISQGKFDKAEEVVEEAERTVNENYLQLGDHLFKQYSGELKQLSERIVEGQSKIAEQLREQRQLAAIEAQRRLRAQMERDRERRITELMESATAYQKQQRYKEALGQLENLLAIESLNDRALILKQTLEDTISFREQLEVQKEADMERVGILLKADKSGIPYAEEMTHPKNWREIIAKPTRKPEEELRRDPLDVAVERQLSGIVDLPGLTPEMPFSEAIEELKKSVEPPLRIVVFWRDLYDNADIDQTTAINMDAILAVPLGRALELLLRSVSGGFVELGYVVENGVITIATKESLPSKLETRVYDVRMLIGRPADFYAATGGGAGGGMGGARGGMGGGGMGGGAGGMGGQFFAEYFEEEEEEIDRAQMAEEMEERKLELIALIQDTIEPDTWEILGGEGTITFYEDKQLIIRQTREIHNRIEKLLKEMRKPFRDQVAIEARFLVVGENFLEDIGLDLDFSLNTHGRLGVLDIDQEFLDFVVPSKTGVLGSLGKTSTPTGPVYVVEGLTIGGTYGNLLLNDLQVDFLLRATQAHRDSKFLTAPKVCVLSGESASFRIQRTYRYALPPDVSTTEMVGGVGPGAVRAGMQQNYGEILTGTILNVTPTITPDKKHVLLYITAEMRDFLGYETSKIHIAGIPGEPTAPALEYEVDLPQTEISRVRTRVSVPDSGTLVLGGQKITEEVEREAGVPILSKIPIIGRAFSNRSKIRDHRILLILVKPTIILQEEKDAEAIAQMEGGF